MTVEALLRQTLEIKAHLTPCPYCGGYTFAEPDPEHNAPAVCINCGWEEDED